ncbi:MAG: lytic transglycosylase domain-containing protein [Bradyrhizobium sp.]
MMPELELLMLCAPAIAPQTVQTVIEVESRGDPLAINVNGMAVKLAPANAAEAATLARGYMARGHTVDLGLMQVNSANLARLGYRVEDMFEPCKNIAAGARVLSEFYATALRQYGDRQTALRAALSAYNTGNFRSGFYNGYLRRYGLADQNGTAPRAGATPAAGALDPDAADTAVSIRQGPLPHRKEEQALSGGNNPAWVDTAVLVREQRQPQQRKEQAMRTDNETGKPPETADGTERTPVVSRSQADWGTPGVQVEYTADQAEAHGAFHETAMSEKDAWASNMDAGADAGGTAIVVKGQKVRGSGP